MSGLVVRPLPAAEWRAEQARLAAFEHSFVYPLGDDHFRIDHGDDYFAFFTALGEPAPYVAEVDGELAGMLVAVCRQIRERDSWYLCDLKVAEQSAGHRIGQRLLQTWARERLAAGQPAFGVSMNPAGTDNRLVRLARRCRDAGPLRMSGLQLFSLDHGHWQSIESRLEAALGPIRWFDPRGTKDIVLASTGAPMPLLHAQHGPMTRHNVGSARPGSTHMFCLPAEDPLVAELTARGIQADASATVVHRDMQSMNWRHLLTSDI